MVEQSCLFRVDRFLLKDLIFMIDIAADKAWFGNLSTTDELHGRPWVVEQRIKSQNWERK